MQRGAEPSGVHSFSSGDISDHYDQFAWAYRRYWGDHIHHGLFVNGEQDAQRAQELMVRHCVRQAGVSTGMTVADVGCGHGITAGLLAREYSCKVLGLTISQAQLELARKACESLNGQVRFELADAEAYAFPAASFDLIWNMESSEHFFDKSGYFGKVGAALKPGGKLMVAAWSGSMQDELIRNIAQIFLCPELWTADEYTRSIDAAGMKIVSREQLGAEVARTWDISAEQIQSSRALLSVLPKQFREFARGIELIREGYRSGQFSYTILVAEAG